MGIMELLKHEVEFDSSDNVVNVRPLVIRLSRDEARIRRNKANHIKPGLRKSTMEQSREVLYSGSRLGLEDAINRIDFRAIERKFGRYEIKVAFDFEDCLWHICVL